MNRLHHTRNNVALSDVSVVVSIYCLPGASQQPREGGAVNIILISQMRWGQTLKPVAQVTSQLQVHYRYRLAHCSIYVTEVYMSLPQGDQRQEGKPHMLQRTARKMGAHPVG